MKGRQNTKELETKQVSLGEKGLSLQLKTKITCSIYNSMTGKLKTIKEPGFGTFLTKN